MPRTFVILLLAGFCACAAPAGPRFESSPEFRALDLPFSEAVRAGNTLYLSGQLGIPPGQADLVPGGIRAEARQALENIERVLEQNGASRDRLVKCTVFLAEISDWPAFNEVYVAFFSGELPARSAFGGVELALGARLELECIAWVD